MTSGAERYLVVKGRRWRREDPTIPATLAAELRSELMSARRAVFAAQRARDVKALRAARTRVQDAKVALGERGTPWWTEWDSRAPRVRAERAAATIRALLRHRAGKTICPSDVARAIAGLRWRVAMPEVRAIVHALAARSEIEVQQGGKKADPARARGPIRLALVSSGRESASPTKCARQFGAEHRPRAVATPRASVDRAL